MTRSSWLLPLSTLALLAGCTDNIVRVWNPNPGGGGGTTGSQIAVVPTGGRVVDGRPRVEAAYPKGGGWPGTAPIVVVFSESIARASVEASSTGGQPGVSSSAKVLLRAQGAAQPLPTTLSWLWGDRALVLTPLAALPAGTTFEVVVDPEVRDVDGVRKGGSGPEIVASFTADQATTVVDGRILAVLPADNARDVMREDDVFVIFDRPADEATVTESSLVVRSGGAPIAGTRTFPLQVAGVTDPRVVRFRAPAKLPGGARVELVVDDTIKFGGGAGKLDFKGRTPFSGFGTVIGAAPQSVAIANSPPGFTNVVNSTNVSNVDIGVAVDASVPTGSRVVVRMYGLDATTAATDDLAFVEVSATSTSDGPTTVTVPFGAALGTPGNLRFDEGPLTLRARVDVGGGASAFATTAQGADPLLDVTPPEFDAFLPAQPGAPNDIVTDQESVVVVGRASERLGSAEITAGTVTKAMHGAADDGTFLMRPIAVGRSADPMPFTLVFADRAGNSIAQPIGGRIVQRGIATGAVAGTLTVEVYDDATLAPLVGATVLVEPGLPQKPAVGRVVATTGADGRATFANRTAGRHSITVVADGYHLTSLLDVPSAFASLGVRPVDDALATAKVKGTLAFIAASGQIGVVGVNALDDPVALEFATSGNRATTIPETAVRAGRPLVVNALTGVFPPTGRPTFAGYACGLCGANGLTPSPPSGPAPGGAVVQLTIPVLPESGTSSGLAAPYALDFSAVGGLGALSGDPVVRVHGTLAGFGRSALFGAGLASVAGAASYTIDAGYALPVVLALAELQPTLWVTTEAHDADGNLTRHRNLLSNPNLGAIYPTGAPLGIPTVSPPAGPSTGAPSITFQDRLDPAGIPGGVAFQTVRVTDVQGRRWDLVMNDRDGPLGARALQLPDLSGVTGLAVGTWQVRIESDLMFSTTAADGDFVLEERQRQQVKFARSARVDFEVR